MNNIELIELIKKMSLKINEHKDYLTELDQPIGDSDHGINMARGFSAIETKLDTLMDKDISTILKQLGMTLVSQVGGSSGPLYGTAFMYAGKVVEGKDIITIEDLPIVLKAMIDGVKMRGKAELNEATMIDAMVPSYEACQKAVNENKTLKQILEETYLAANKGADNTINMIATKGRASYVGERGIGHKDPGAQSFVYLIEAIKEYYE